jgi:hypothetical protein
MLSVPASPAASQVELLSASVSVVASTGHRAFGKPQRPQRGRQGQRPVFLRARPLFSRCTSHRAHGGGHRGRGRRGSRNRSGADTINKDRGPGSYWGLASRKYRTRGRGALNAERPTVQDQPLRSHTRGRGASNGACEQPRRIAPILGLVVPPLEMLGYLHRLPLPPRGGSAWAVLIAMVDGGQ